MKFTVFEKVAAGLLVIIAIISILVAVLPNYDLLHAM